MSKKQRYAKYSDYFEFDRKNDALLIDPDIFKRRKEIGASALWDMMAFFSGCFNYRTCSQCGYTGPAMDKHHFSGRKNSNEVIDVCANCHREIHAGTRVIR